MARNPWDFGTNTEAGLWGDNRAARDAEWAKVGLNPSGRYPGFDLGKRGIVGLFPTIGQQVTFAGEMEPIREQMIRNFITQNNPNNSNYLVDAARRNALSNAIDSRNQAAVMGYGGGYTDMGSALSEANQAGQDAYTQVHSPEFQNGLYQNVLGAVNQGQQISLLPAAQGFHDLTLSTPRNQSGLGAALGVLGNVAGAFSGGMGGGLGSGMLGSGAGNSFGGGISGGLGNIVNPGQGIANGLSQVPWGWG